MGETRRRSGRWLPVLGKILVGVICVLLLAAILLPVTGGSRASPRIAQQSKIKQVGLGLIMYASDYDGKLPPAMSTNLELRQCGLRYTKNVEIFKSLNPAGGEIVGNGLLAGKSIDHIVNPAATVMGFDSRPWAENYGVLSYADGHSKASIPFETMLQQLTVDPFNPSQHPGRHMLVKGSKH